MLPLKLKGKTHCLPVAGPEVAVQLVEAEHTFSVQTALPSLLQTQVLQSACQDEPGLLVVQVDCPVLLQMQVLQSSCQVLPGMQLAVSLPPVPVQVEEQRPYWPVMWDPSERVAVEHQSWFIVASVQVE